MLSAQLLAPLLLGQPYIPVTEWAPSFRLIAHIANEIIINSRKCFVEFGAGVSTILLARLMKLNNLDVTFFSVEDNTDWIEVQRSLLKRDGCDDLVTFIHSPLRDVRWEGLDRDTIWYSKNEILEAISGYSIDLVFVDAPKGDVPFARYGAVPVLKNYLDKNFCIFLDDTNREEERATLRLWKECLGADTMTYHGTYGTIQTGDGFGTVPALSKIRKI